MDVTPQSALIAAIFAGFGVIITKIVEALAARHKAKIEDKKLDSEINKSELQQAVEMYRQIIIDLREDIRQLMEHISTLETDHLKCCTENASLRMEIKSVKERIAFLESEIVRYQSNDKA